MPERHARHAPQMAAPQMPLTKLRLIADLSEKDYEKRRKKTVNGEALPNPPQDHIQ